MKKLIAMIGAVAMSFCAFADEEVQKPGISFETDEPGVSEGTFTPPSPAWTWSSEDPLELGTYADSELAAAGVYEASGDKARRTGRFRNDTDNNSYLKLDTGTAELTRTMDADPGVGYVDQLVKFTGFEDPQTNLTAGIGVWMGEFVTNDTDDVELTETNLYVTVGKGAEQIALKIDKFGDNDFVAKVDQWYRLTIKPLGNIYKGNFEGDTRAGFAIYINGEKVSSSDSDAKDLTEYKEQMTKAAKDAMDAGQLFTAVTAGPAAHTIAGFKGVGAIDDIILTAEQPKFTIETVDVTFASITGAIIDKVEDAEGEVEPVNGVYTVKPGDLTVTLAAAPGYKMKGTSVYNVNTSTAVEGVITLSVPEGDFVEVVATVTNGSTTTEYAEAELFAAFAALTAGDQVAILKGCSVTNGEEETLYTFTSNTTIDVAADGWDVFVGNYIGAAQPTIDKVGVAAAKIKAFTFEDAENGQLTIAANINGELIATNGTTTVGANIALGEAALLKAKSIVFGGGRNPFKITLSGAAKVMTTNNAFTAEQIIPGEGELEVSEQPDEDGYYTYQIAAAPGTFKVTCAEVVNGTVETSVTNNVAPGTEVTVTATPAAGYALESITTNDATITGNTFVMPAEDVTVGATFTRQMVTITLPDVGQIEGVSELVVSQKVDEVWEEVTGDPLTIGVGNEYVVVAIPDEDYRAQNPIVQDTAVAGTPIEVTEQQVKDNITKIVYVAQVGNTKYETLAEAVAADGDVMLLDNVTLTETLTIAKAKALNLAGKTVTFGADLAKGIKITVDGVAITNGTITSALTANLAYSKAIEVAHANATFKDLTINAAHYEYAIYANCDEACGNDLAWFYTQQADDFKTLTCDGVEITGNGSLFHVEGMVATLNNCSATYDHNTLFANEAHRAAVYSSVNARTTITGSGTYEHEKALLSGNLGGKITVADGATAEFTGTIYSWMQTTTTHDDLKQYADYKAEYVLNGGTYNCTVAFKEDGARDLDSFVKNAMIEIPAPEGYIWYNDITLGKPIIATFKVDGEVVNAQTNIEAFTPTAPVIPEKTGYTAAWDPAVAQISASREYTAVYTAIPYTLTLTGGENVTTNVNPEKATYTYGETVAITATPKTGFTYEGVALGEGWGLNEGGAATNTVTITGNASVAIPNAKKAAITVTVKKGEGIDTVTVGGTPLVFDEATSEATFDVSPDAPTATLTLAAVSTITIPVYKQALGSFGASVVAKTFIFTADVEKENYVTFTAAEADVDDPQVEESDKKQAIIDAIDAGDSHNAAVAKVNAIVTTETTPAEGNKVTATELATYITEKSVKSADLAASDYVVASVKLDTDSLITEGTEVKVNTVEKTTSDLAVTIKVGDEDATKEQIMNYVEVCDDLGAANDWEKLPQSTLKKAVTITAGKLVITPVAGIDKLFLKVVIPEDPKGVE